jgi:hypothetical protein
LPKQALKVVYVQRLGSADSREVKLCAMTEADGADS